MPAWIDFMDKETGAQRDRGRLISRRAGVLTQAVGLRAHRLTVLPGSPLTVGRGDRRLRPRVRPRREPAHTWVPTPAGGRAGTRRLV